MPFGVGSGSVAQERRVDEEPESIDEEFSRSFEAIVERARPPESRDNVDWDEVYWQLTAVIERLVNEAGQQDPKSPGKLRIDPGHPRIYSEGFDENPDTVLIFDFDMFQDRFLARYNLADELIRYAEDGEGGWDIVRYIDQLQRTIDRLRTEAIRRGWIAT